MAHYSTMDGPVTAIAAHVARWRPALFAGALLSGLAPSAAQAIDPLALYRGDMLFEIYRDDRAVGSHRVAFEGPADDLTVTARSEIAVPFLGFIAYRFRYQSSSAWRGGTLDSLDAKTDDDGKTSFVQAKRLGGTLSVTGTSGPQAAPAGIFSTDHWHGGVRGAPMVLNTITGAVNKVVMTSEGFETVETGTGPREAEKWRYSGELDTVVWYDRQGRWVRLQFRARDGSTITYVCRQCGPEPA
jgi:hypothetical protein